MQQVRNRRKGHRTNLTNGLGGGLTNLPRGVAKRTAQRRNGRGSVKSTKGGCGFTSILVTRIRCEDPYESRNGFLGPSPVVADLLNRSKTQNLVRGAGLLD